MTPFDRIRPLVLPALPTPCLVAPDRTGRALLVSDFPARYDAMAARGAADALARAGFAVDIAGGLARLDFTPRACAQWLDSLPRAPLPAPGPRAFRLWGVCALLLRHDRPGAACDPALLRRAVLLTQQKDVPALTRCLGQALARALRAGDAPPAGLARLALLAGLLNDTPQRRNA